jgi:cysteine desulfurase NifS
MNSDHKKKNLIWKKAICGICPAGCWVQVGMKNGRMMNIKADTGHPLGMICHRGEHAPEIVYSENRLHYPMKRKGKKGNHEFERISWDEAYDLITQNLNNIKDISGPEATAIYTGRGAFELSLCDIYQPRDIAVSSASNILFPFGSPNTMGVGALCYVSFAMIAPHLTMGRMLINMFTDMENSQLMVVWGANPATDSPPLDMYRLEAAAKEGAEVVVIDPRRTETVKRTGAEWIPIRPGTDGALALSMIEVMIEEDLYDEEFAENWCHGFNELKSYMQHFRPEVVDKITGVPAGTIRNLAHRLCRATSACLVMYTGLEYSDSGIQAIRAVFTLFSLAGHLDVPGGIGLSMLNTHFPINRSCNQKNPDLNLAIARDKFPIYSRYRGESHASGLVSAVLTGQPYRIRGLIIHGASLLTSWPQTALWRETLSKLDFQVCIDRQLTADAAYADIVLPATTMFEIDSYMTYGPIFRLREKVIDPVGEARNDYLILAELTKRLGYGHLYPQSEKEMIDFVLKGSGYSLDEIKREGGSVKIQTPMMEYRKWEKGKLRADGKPGFETPTGKFEIWSTILEDHGYEPLPKYIEPEEGPIANPELLKEYPLVFNSGARPQTDFRSQHHGIKSLLKDNPEPTVELNLGDAVERGIENGDLVEVQTLRGSVPFRARVTEDIVKGAVECNMGGGTPVGPNAWQNWNVNKLTDLGKYDTISGFPVYKALLCEVTKIKDGNDYHKKVLQKQECLSGQLFEIEAKKNIPEHYIYLDNNATTPLADEVREEMLPYLEYNFGNPSAIYGIGRKAREGMDKARQSIARLINARPRSIIFTGSGSESDNLALTGFAYGYKKRGNHIITSTIEHPAILNTCKFLETVGLKITYLDVDKDGLIDPAQLSKAITEKTILVSIMMANNEVGTIQPISELCKIAHEKDILFHSDAVQAAGKIPIDVQALNVDMLTISGHKFHGPKGVGILYVKRGIELEALIHGGKQENNIRAGTENVAGIAGMGKAAELAAGRVQYSQTMTKLRDYLQTGIQKLIPGVKLNGKVDQRLPNTLNLTLPALRGESFVMALDQRGIALSSGSACKSGSPDPTHVLLAMGRSEEDAHCSIRFSLSSLTTRKNIKDTLAAIEVVLKEMENTIRFLPCK